MFEGLSDKMLATLKRVRGQSKITEQNIQDAMKDIRMSLLEADVHFKVVKTFVDRVRQKALGQEVLSSVSAGQQFVKIVHDELIEILGGGTVSLNLKTSPSVIFLVGLQGAGKTTTAAKLALYIRKNLQKKPGLVPVDVYRPAAIDQLQTLAKQNELPVFASQASQRPEEILAAARSWAESQMVEVVIVDTAGRMQVDEELMGELERLGQIWAPSEVLLVADAMLGQQSVNVALGFQSRLSLSGLILTKMDGDARGGAALSIRETTGVPIKFLGLGEKVSALEVFHPDRLAGRILDMGDVVTLVEKARDVIDEKGAREAARKIAKNQFTVEDFLSQIQMMRKMGGLEGIMKLIPGMGQAVKQMKDMAPPEKEIKKIEAIIRSMTLKERANLQLLNGSRRLRIAKGSGTQVSDVNKFVKQFEESAKMMNRMMKMGMGKGGFKLPF